MFWYSECLTFCIWFLAQGIWAVNRRREVSIRNTPFTFQSFIGQHHHPFCLVRIKESAYKFSVNFIENRWLFKHLFRVWRKMSAPAAKRPVRKLRFCDLFAQFSIWMTDKWRDSISFDVFAFFQRLRDNANDGNQNANTAAVARVVAVPEGKPRMYFSLLDDDILAKIFGK